MMLESPAYIMLKWKETKNKREWKWKWRIWKSNWPNNTTRRMESESDQQEQFNNSLLQSSVKIMQEHPFKIWNLIWNWWKTRQRYAAVILEQICQHTTPSHQMQQNAIDFDPNCRFAKDLLLLNIVQLHTMPNLLLWVCGMSEKKWEMKQILSDAILLSSRYRWVSFSQCLQSFFSGHVAEKKFKQISKTFDFHVKPFYLIVILWVKS